MSRTLFIGDIHGCATELDELLDRAGVVEGDRVVALGDLVDEGPARWEVLMRFGWDPDPIERQPDDAAPAVPGPDSPAVLYSEGGVGFLSLRGDCEELHARAARHHASGPRASQVRASVERELVKPSGATPRPYIVPALVHERARRELGRNCRSACAFMGSRPLTFTRHGALVAHALPDPERRLDEQRGEWLLGLKSFPTNCEPSSQAEARRSQGAVHKRVLASTCACTQRSRAAMDRRYGRRGATCREALETGEGELRERGRLTDWFAKLERRALLGPDEVLIVGHRDYLSSGQALVCQLGNGRKFVGLDTSCSRGGRLTGLWMPDFSIVSVPSGRNYWAVGIDLLRREVALALTRVEED